MLSAYRNLKVLHSQISDRRCRAELHVRLEVMHDYPLSIHESLTNQTFLPGKVEVISEAFALYAQRLVSLMTFGSLKLVWLQESWLVMSFAKLSAKQKWIKARDKTSFFIPVKPPPYYLNLLIQSNLSTDSGYITLLLVKHSLNLSFIQVERKVCYLIT